MALGVFDLVGVQIDYWISELQAVRLRIAEIEGKIAALRQVAQELHAQGRDNTLQTGLINVSEETLARTRTHLEFIEQQIQAILADAERRQRILAEIRSFVGERVEHDKRRR